MGWNIYFIFDLDLCNYGLLLTLDVTFYEFLIEFCISLLMELQNKGAGLFPT
jgi:hypothetical protein